MVFYLEELQVIVYDPTVNLLHIILPPVLESSFLNEYIKLLLIAFWRSIIQYAEVNYIKIH